ncbi:MAG: site-2 protease family protein [Thermomicrobiales bacterium]
MQPARPTALWRSFVSRGTLISGILAVVVWTVTLGWVAGIGLVILLYIHELGHLLAARWRRIPVRGAPIFIPGFGAFVQIQPAARVWDEIIVALGGPVVGGAVALALGVAAAVWTLPTLAFAGFFGLALNLVNLLPFTPLDGGKIIARTGWLGFVPTLLLGTALLAFISAFKFSLLLTAIIVFGILWAYRGARRGKAVRWRTRIGILSVYLLVSAVLLAGVAWSSPTYFFQPGVTRQSPALIAPASWISGLAVDSAGNVYLAEAAAQHLRSFTPAGQPRAEWTAANALPADAYVTALAFDHAGDLYLADAANVRILKLSPDGALLAQWELAGTEADPPNLSALAVDARGFVYAVDDENGQVLALSPAGAVLARWPFDAASGVATDSAGNVYVAELDTARISKLAPDGTVLARWPTGQGSQPVALALDGAGNLYIADGGNQVREFSPTGAFIAAWTPAVPDERSPASLSALTVDDAGQVYLAGWRGARVGTFAPDGRLLASWRISAEQTPTSAATAPVRDGLFGALERQSGRLPWLPDAGVLAEWAFALVLLCLLLDAAAWRVALRPERRAAGRYLLLPCCWPRLLLSDRWAIPGLLCLAAQFGGLPGLRWLEGLVRRLAAHGQQAAGSICGFAYDCLRRQGRDADAWLARQTPLIRQAGPLAATHAFSVFLTVGYRGRFYPWLVELLEGYTPDELTTTISWIGVNNLAYSLAMVGRPADALPFARAALARNATNPYVHGTLGEILLALDDPAGAEAELRQSLHLRNQTVNRLALARALAAQGRYPEAIAEAEHSLRQQPQPWPDDLPGRATVAAWIAAWQTNASGTPAIVSADMSEVAVQLPGN